MEVPDKVTVRARGCPTVRERRLIEPFMYTVYDSPILLEEIVYKYSSMTLQDKSLRSERKTWQDVAATNSHPIMKTSFFKFSTERTVIVVVL